MILLTKLFRMALRGTVAQPGFHLGGGGGVRALRAGPLGITGPRFSLTAASVGPRYYVSV